MIDPPVPLFKPELFTAFLAFARRKTVTGRRLLIHCNKGESRAPSLALLFLAKVTGTISDESFGAARAGFDKLFRGYSPGLGIETYLRKNWTSLRGL